MDLADAVPVALAVGLLLLRGSGAAARRERRVHRPQPARHQSAQTSTQVAAAGACTAGAAGRGGVRGVPATPRRRGENQPARPRLPAGLLSVHSLLTTI